MKNGINFDSHFSAILAATSPLGYINVVVTMDDVATVVNSIINKNILYFDFPLLRIHKTSR
jgi:hypothetical protein